MHSSIDVALSPQLSTHYCSALSNAQRIVRHYKRDDHGRRYGYSWQASEAWGRKSLPDSPACKWGFSAGTRQQATFRATGRLHIPACGLSAYLLGLQLSAALGSRCARRSCASKVISHARQPLCPRLLPTILCLYSGLPAQLYWSGASYPGGGWNAYDGSWTRPPYPPPAGAAQVQVRKALVLSLISCS